MKDDITFCRDIFRAYSKTYYLSSLFFPKAVREEVWIFYAFVRLADELVDNPQEEQHMYRALQDYIAYFHACFHGESMTPPRDHLTPDDIRVIEIFAVFAQQKKIAPEWIDAFFESMKMDLCISTYPTFEDLYTYTYGSAEVIGLVMARIMNVPDEGLYAAQMLGRSFQLINFLRDVQEDLERGRLYIPLELLKKHGCSEESLWLDEKPSPKGLALLEDFIATIVETHKEAEAGFQFIPDANRKAVLLASHGYLYTFNKIRKNPGKVFFQSPKNSKLEMFIVICMSFLTPRHGAITL